MLSSARWALRGSRPPSSARSCRRRPAGPSSAEACRNRSNILVSTRSGGRSARGRPRQRPAPEPADVRGIAAEAVLVSGYLFLQEPGHDVAVAAVGSVQTPLLAVEAASWPLLEAFGVQRFFDETGSCDVVFANEREARVLTGADG